MALFKCSICGYIEESDNLSEKCLKCGAPSDKIEKMNDEDAKKVYDSDNTNSIHMEIISLAEQMIGACIDGIEDNLDPNCVKAFEFAKDRAWEIKQMCKAELAGHMSKGKW